MTRSQSEALEWLRERNGTGVWERPGATVLIAAGERATPPAPPSTQETRN